LKLARGPLSTVNHNHFFVRQKQPRNALDAPKKANVSNNESCLSPATTIGNVIKAIIIITIITCELVAQN